jgi:hypothetical protein
MRGVAGMRYERPGGTYGADPNLEGVMTRKAGRGREADNGSPTGHRECSRLIGNMVVAEERPAHVVMATFVAPCRIAPQCYYDPAAQGVTAAPVGGFSTTSGDANGGSNECQAGQEYTSGSHPSLVKIGVGTTTAVSPS